MTSSPLAARDPQYRDRALTTASHISPVPGMDLVVATQVSGFDGSVFEHSQTWQNGRPVRWDEGITDDAGILLIRSVSPETQAQPEVAAAHTKVQVLDSGAILDPPPLCTILSAPWRRIGRATVRATFKLAGSPFGDLPVAVNFEDGLPTTACFVMQPQSDLSVTLPAEAGYLLLAADLLLSQVPGGVEMDGSIGHVSCFQGLIHQDEYVLHARRFRAITNFFARYSALMGRPDVLRWQRAL